MILHITELDELQDHIKNSDKVVVDFSAPAWCVPCQRLALHYTQAAEKLNGQWVFIEVDIDKAPDIQEHYGIMTVPTVKKFVYGDYVSEVEGRTYFKLINELNNNS